MTENLELILAAKKKIDSLLSFKLLKVRRKYYGSDFDEMVLAICDNDLTKFSDTKIDLYNSNTRAKVFIDEFDKMSKEMLVLIEEFYVKTSNQKLIATQVSSFLEKEPFSFRWNFILSMIDGNESIEQEPILSIMQKYKELAIQISMAT